MAGQGGARVMMTRQGWVGSGGAGLEVREEGARPKGRDAKFSGSKVGGVDVDYWDLFRLAVEVGWGS